MPASSRYTSAQIKAFARDQLQTDEIPSTYLTQLREHLAIFPHDYLFRLRPFAGPLKYGVIDCLEPGCEKSNISLYPRESVADGGKAQGIGGLTAFQSHIRDEPLHVVRREERTGTEKANRGASKLANSRETCRDGRDDNPYQRPGSSKRSSSVLAGDDHVDFKKLKREHSPIVIDSESDADSVRALSKVPEVPAVASEAVDYIWLDGQGLVPLAQFMAQTAITESNHRGQQHATGPVASSSREMLSPAPSNRQPSNLITRSRIATRLKEAQDSHAQHSLALKQAFEKSDWSAIKEFRMKVSQESKAIELLTKQFNEVPHSNDLSSSRSLADTKPSLLSSSHIIPDMTPRNSRVRSTLVDSSLGLAARNSRPDVESGLSGSSRAIFSPGRASLAPGKRSVSPDANDSHSSDREDPCYEMEPLIHMTNAERELFYKKAIINLDFEKSVTVAEAKKTLNIPEGADALMPGLSIPLYPHQIIGIAWMLKQEKESNHRGGMLADEMGLGKTVQMIATMIANPAPESLRKTTLIVAPLALTTQWKKEIKRKATTQFRILIYYGKDRPSKKALQQYDVVITTYGLLNEEWADDKAALKALANPDITASRRSRSGSLFSVDWHRVVLDESQAIRNPNAKISRAVYHLEALYRWSLTGTPIFNRLLDIYPQLRFLKIRPYNDISEFRQRICRYEKRRPNLAGQRAQAILKTFMLRRQKSSQLDGKPLIPLPDKHVTEIMLDLSPEERHLYDCIESRMQARFNKFLRAGTVLKNYAHILVMLLRLRQACGHIALCTEDDETNALLSASRKDPPKELERATNKLGQEWVDRVKEKCQAELDELNEAEKDDPTATIPECPICSENLDESARITKCFHTFCADCIEQIMNHDDHVDAVHDRLQDPDKVEKPCPNCRAPIRRPDTYLRKAFMPNNLASDRDNDSDDERAIRVSYRSRNNVIADSDEEELPDEIHAKGKGKQKARYAIEPSTKIVWLLEELQTLRKESPGDKVIVFSQWVSLLDLVAQCLDSNGFKYVRYQGDMKPPERVEAVDKFEDNDGIPLMLMSLKCGGVGLNLTRGNRVISLDLAWSPATEAQAFDRVHRLGQNKEVFVKRVMINNSVEQRMCELQGKKRSITENALGEGDGTRLTRMTVEQLASLFNLDGEGNELN